MGYPSVISELPLLGLDDLVVAAISIMSDDAMA
jgi:hypothetical protein